MSSKGFVRQAISDRSSLRSASGSLAAVAAKRLAIFRSAQQGQSTETLLEFIPRISRELEAPEHLGEYVRELERAPGAGLRFVAAAPPQHGKSESVKHAIVYWLGRLPKKRHAYATYSQDQAEYVSLRTQQLAADAGLRPEGNLQTWRV